MNFKIWNLGYFGFVMFAIALTLMLVANYLFSDSKTVPPQRILIDSLPLSKSQTLYWFYLADQLGDKSTKFLTIGDDPCKVSNSDALIRGDFIYDINSLQGDTIYLTSSGSFQTLKGHPTFAFQKIEVQSKQTFKRHSLKEEILLSSICK